METIEKTLEIKSILQNVADELKKDKAYQKWGKGSRTQIDTQQWMKEYRSDLVVKVGKLKFKEVQKGGFVLAQMLFGGLMKK